jgi:hypothetical protein
MTKTDGQRLAEAFSGIVRAQFAKDHGLKGGGSLISQHISGNRPISLDAAIVYAHGLKLTLDEVSPAIAQQVRDAAPFLATTGTVYAREIPPPYVNPPTLERALPVVLDAIAAAPSSARQELAQVLPLAVQTGAHVYRQRVAELLTDRAEADRRQTAETLAAMAAAPAITMPKGRAPGLPAVAAVPEPDTSGQPSPRNAAAPTPAASKARKPG